MSDDGDKDKGQDAERPARPDNAAGRRARRGSSRAGKGEAPKGKSGSSGPADSRSGSSSTATKQEEKLPLPKRMVRYLREVVAELQKVIWPTRKQMGTYTVVVLAFLAFMIALVWLLDLAFGQVIGALFT